MKPFKISFLGKAQGHIDLKWSNERKKYDPDRNYVGWVKKARELAKTTYEHMGYKDPYTGALKVSIVVINEIPNNFGSVKKSMARTNEIAPILSPHLLNIERALDDACKEIIYQDGTQIIVLEKHKRYEAHQGSPRMEVTFASWPS